MAYHPHLGSTEFPNNNFTTETNPYLGNEPLASGSLYLRRVFIHLVSHGLDCFTKTTTVQIIHDTCLLLLQTALICMSLRVLSFSQTTHSYSLVIFFLLGFLSSKALSHCGFFPFFLHWKGHTYIVTDVQKQHNRQEQPKCFFDVDTTMLCKYFDSDGTFLTTWSYRDVHWKRAQPGGDSCLVLASRNWPVLSFFPSRW